MRRVSRGNPHAKTADPGPTASDRRLPRRRDRDVPRALRLPTGHLLSFHPSFQPAASARVWQLRGVGSNRAESSPEVVRGGASIWSGCLRLRVRAFAISPRLVPTTPAPSPGRGDRHAGVGWLDTSSLAASLEETRTRCPCRTASATSSGSIEREGWAMRSSPASVAAETLRHASRDSTIKARAPNHSARAGSRLNAATKSIASPGDFASITIAPVGPSSQPFSFSTSSSREARNTSGSRLGSVITWRFAQ